MSKVIDINEVNINDSAIKAAVVGWLTSYDSYDADEDGVRCALEDLQKGGCVSGMVGPLTFYNQTTAFFEEHKEEINEMLKEDMFQMGLECSIFSSERFDKDDMLCLETTNQNLLAWWAFEERAREVYVEMFEQEED